MTTTDDGDGGPHLDDVTEPDGLRIENDALQARPRPRIALRSWFTVVLVVLTALSLVATSLAVWVHRTVFDTDRFMDTVTPALDDPAFYAVLSDRTAEQVLEALDLDTRVTARLTSLEEYLAQALPESLGLSQQERRLLSAFDRPSLEALGPVVVGALEERVVAAIDRFITSEEFRALLPELVRRAHVSLWPASGVMSPASRTCTARMVSST